MSQPGTISVFIADDHAIIREGLAALLVAQPDIRIAGTAGNGREALAGVLQELGATVSSGDPILWGEGIRAP